MYWLLFCLTSSQQKQQQQQTLRKRGRVCGMVCVLYYVCLRECVYGVLVCVCVYGVCVCVYVCVCVQKYVCMCVLLGASGSMKFFVGCAFCWSC